VRSLDASWCDLDLAELVACLSAPGKWETIDVSGNATIFAPRAGVDPYATFGAVLRAMPEVSEVCVLDTNADPHLLVACLHALHRPIRCRMRAHERPAAIGLVSVTWVH
jgi:hypothetical protein